MSLPTSFTERYLALSEGCSMYGTPVEELTRDELLAALAYAMEAQREAVKEGARRLDFMAGLKA